MPLGIRLLFHPGTANPHQAAPAKVERSAGLKGRPIAASGAALDGEMRMRGAK